MLGVALSLGTRGLGLSARSFYTSASIPRGPMRRFFGNGDFDLLGFLGDLPLQRQDEEEGRVAVQISEGYADLDPGERSTLSNWVGSTPNKWARWGDFAPECVRESVKKSPFPASDICAYEEKEAQRWDGFPRVWNALYREMAVESGVDFVAQVCRSLVNRTPTVSCSSTTGTRIASGGAPLHQHYKDEVSEQQQRQLVFAQGVPIRELVKNPIFQADLDGVALDGVYLDTEAECVVPATEVNLLGGLGNTLFYYEEGSVAFLRELLGLDEDAGHDDLVDAVYCRLNSYVDGAIGFLEDP